MRGDGYVHPFDLSFVVLNWPLGLNHSGIGLSSRIDEKLLLFTT